MRRINSTSCKIPDRLPTSGLLIIPRDHLPFAEPNFPIKFINHHDRCHGDTAGYGEQPKHRALHRIMFWIVARNRGDNESDGSSVPNSV